MMYGIIDIGSNTIRLAIYEIQGQTLELLLKKKFMTGLAAYVQHSVMSEQGVDKAVDALLDFKRMLANFRIENVCAFATAALRNVNNSAWAVSEIERRTGISIDLISGTEEAFLDFVGATHEMPVGDGILVDIGGGSTELVVYRNQQILEMMSLPVGSLNLYTAHVENLFPTPTERCKIQDQVRHELKSSLGASFEKQQSICGIGGTLRATGKLHNAVYDLAEDHVEMTVAAVHDLYQILTEQAHEDGMPLTKNLDLMLKVVPERVRTVLPGMIVLETIADFIGGERIRISSSGVREGYIYERVLK